MTEQAVDIKMKKKSSKKISYTTGEAEKITQDLKKMLQAKPPQVQIKEIIESSYDDIIALQNMGYSLQDIAQRFCNKQNQLSSKNLESLLKKIRSVKQENSTGTVELPKTSNEIIHPRLRNTNSLSDNTSKASNAEIPEDRRKWLKKGENTKEINIPSAANNDTKKA